MTYYEFIQNIIDTRGQWNEEIRCNYCERHHIVPRCFGGQPKKVTWKHHNNIIWLTPKEHYIAHKLLYEENPHEPTLLNAWCAMAFPKNHGDIKISSDEYEMLRIKWANSLRNKPRSEELKQKLHQNSLINPNYGMRGKHHSKKTKLKMSKIMSGDNNPSKRPEVREKISKALKNRKFDNSAWMKKIKSSAKSENTRKKKSMAKKGKRIYTNGVERHYYFEGTQPDGYYLYKWHKK